MLDYKVASNGLQVASKCCPRYHKASFLMVSDAVGETKDRITSPHSIAAVEPLKNT